VPGQQLRIIGGRHRGRKLRFADLPGLRPSGDRGRETLFNWLQPVIPGARVLDLFAGSGALGFEAVSRGAGSVIMVERAGKAVRLLRDNARLLGEDVDIVQADALAWLPTVDQRFDIVFLDPPFADELLDASIAALLRFECLAPGALIYMETNAAKGLPELPAPLAWARQKRMGQVAFGLAEADRL